MPSVMRTLLIADNRNKTLLYGHSIIWELSEIDYTVKKWKQFTSGDISAYFKDIESQSSLPDSLNSGIFDLSPDLNVQISFDFPNSEEFFIEQSYDEDNFNPFISLCTFAKVWFKEYTTAPQDNPADFVRTHKESLEKIKERYHLDLLGAPHLIGTFCIFTPTRIEENFKGIENEQTVGYKISLLDYFNLYSGAMVSVESTAGTQTHSEHFVLDNEVHTFNCGFVPDKNVTTIKLNDIVIYRSSFCLLKKISVRLNVIEEKKIVSGDKVIVQVKSTGSSFDV
jgi:hypothetical protein